MRRKDRLITEYSKILPIIEAAHICRIAFFAEDYPYIVPMNFGYTYTPADQLHLYFHGAQTGRKLDLLGQNPQVGFELDSHTELIQGENPCNYSYAYSSIIGDGLLEIITDTTKKCQALDLIMQHETGQTFERFSYDDTILKKTAVLHLTVRSFSVKQRSLS